MLLSINTLISHLENLRDGHDVDEVKVTVPTLDGEDISFIPLDSLKDINIIKIPVDGETKVLLYIDVDGLLDFEPEEDIQ